MSRNRIKNSQSLHWMGVVKWILILGLMSVLGLSYMLCKNQNLHLAEEARKLEVQLGQITERNSQLSLDLERMKSPRELQRRLALMRSDLVRLEDERLKVVWLDQNTRVRLARMGTQPSSVNLISPVVATSATAAEGSATTTVNYRP